MSRTRFIIACAVLFTTWLVTAGTADACHRRCYVPCCWDYCCTPCCPWNGVTKEKDFRIGPSTVTHLIPPLNPPATAIIVGDMLDIRMLNNGSTGYTVVDVCCIWLKSQSCCTSLTTDHISVNNNGASVYFRTCCKGETIVCIRYTARAPDGTIHNFDWHFAVTVS